MFQMGELSDALNNFQETSRKYYQDIMGILEDKYCWKCPMRTNRKETLCQEVEAWVRLAEAMEGGVREELNLKNFSMEKLEVITAKFLEKKMKPTSKGDDTLILKLEDDAEPLAKSGDFLYVKTNPHRVIKDDLVLLPRVCPMASFWYKETIKQGTIPFKIFKVNRTFQKNGCRYIQTREGLEIPVEFLMGVVKNIIDQHDLSIEC